jgi:hypothetical protein
VLFWKVYVIFIALLSLPLFLGGSSGGGAEFAIDSSLLVVQLIGLFGFAWSKRIFPALFWKVFFPICAAWNLGHAFLTVRDISGLILTAIYLPTLIGTYMYAFKREHLWEP